MSAGVFTTNCIQSFLDDPSTTISNVKIFFVLKTFMNPRRANERADIENRINIIDLL